VVAEDAYRVALVAELLDDGSYLVGLAVEGKVGADLQPAAAQGGGDRVVTEVATADRCGRSRQNVAWITV
jgi:hypothetical protein